MDTTKRAVDKKEAGEDQLGRPLTGLEAKLAVTAMRAEAVARRLIKAKPAGEKAPKEVEEFLDYVESLFNRHRALGVFLTASDKKHFRRWHKIARAILKGKNKGGLAKSD